MYYYVSTFLFINTFVFPYNFEYFITKILIPIVNNIYKSKNIKRIIDVNIITDEIQYIESNNHNQESINNQESTNNQESINNQESDNFIPYISPKEKTQTNEYNNILDDFELYKINNNLEIFMPSINITNQYNINNKSEYSDLPELIEINHESENSDLPELIDNNIINHINLDDYNDEIQNFINKSHLYLSDSTEDSEDTEDTEDSDDDKYDNELLLDEHIKSYIKIEDIE